MQSNRGIQRSNQAPATTARALRLLTFPLLIVAFLALSATPALAAKTHHLIATIDAGYTASAVVDEKTGNVLIADAIGEVVNIFGPEGGPPSGVASPFKIEGVSGVQQGGMAVDNSATSPSQGTLYIVAEAATVKKFALNPISEKYEAKGELSASPAFERATSVAVDSKGNLFVGDSTGKAVVEFDPSGAQIARIDLSASIGAPGSVALDSKGDLFVTNSDRAVYRFDANGSGEIEVGTEPVQVVRKPIGEGPLPGGLAIDLSSDDLYVGMDNSALGNNHVDQYSASCAPEGEGEDEHCAPEGEFGSGTFGIIRSLAVNPETGYVYVADSGQTTGHPNQDVAVFGPNLLVPGSLTGAATGVSGTAATLNGSVDPAGSEVDECKFEWGLDESYGHIAPCAESPAEIGAGNAPVAVHADISGLGIGTAHHFRLVATNGFTIPDEKGPAVGADAAFTTLGPRVSGESFSAVGDTTVTLEGLVNPRSEATSYVFEYVSQADFEAGEYAKATSVPLGGEAIGSGNVDVAVAQELSGLEPSTVYHFRIAATNPSGTAHGPGLTFRTYPKASAGLPDGRVYEQVTPVDKNGAAPSGVLREVQAAAAGNGIVYLSGAGIPGAEGSQQFPTYLSSRGSDWSTQGLLPPASFGSFAAVLGVSEDFSRAYVVQTEQPGDPVSFLLRDNATHSLRPIASEAGRLSSFTYLGASADNSVVVFESDTVLPPGGAAKGRNVYAWDSLSGELSLVGVFNKGEIPVKGSLGGPNQSNYQGFYAQDQHTVSSDGSRVFFSDANTGQLYVRENPTQSQSELDGGGKCIEAALACTVQVSASQRAVADPKGKKPTVFWGASPDGSSVFFTSPGKLTDDASTGPSDEGNDLYRYDLASEELIDIAPDTEPGDLKGADVQGVFGASSDGSYVYFAANGVLAPGATPGDCVHGDNIITFGSGSCNIYLWHDGATVFVAPLRLRSDVWGSGIQDERTSRVSADGKALLFDSKAQLTAYDSEGTREFYRYSAAEDALSCVTCNPTGAAPTGYPNLRSITKYGGTLPPMAPVYTRNLSADGSRVFFETPDKLLASDINGDAGCPKAAEVHRCQDVYEWEADGSGSCHSKEQNGGCLYLLSTGTSPEPAYFGDASVNGDDAFIYTGQRLVGQDTDQILDIYDARVGGGIASQNPAPPPVPCEGEACKGAPSASPTTESAGSAGFVGPANKKPAHKHKKHQHKKKRHHKRRHASQKRG